MRHGIRVRSVVSLESIFAMSKMTEVLLEAFCLHLRYVDFAHFVDVIQALVLRCWWWIDQRGVLGLGKLPVVCSRVLHLFLLYLIRKLIPLRQSVPFASFVEVGALNPLA